MNKVRGWALWFDRFGTPVTLNFEGANTINSYCGSFVTLVILVLVLLQAYQKSFELLTRSTASVLIYEETNYYNDEYWVDAYDLGFHVAFDATNDGEQIDDQKVEWYA